MANATTVDAIMDNLRAILTVQGFQVEDDGIGTDINLDLVPYIQVLYSGETFGAAHGQRSLYNEVNVGMTFYINDDNPTTAREKAQIWTHKIRESVTVSTLNASALSASLLVSWVMSQRTEIAYARPITTVTYRMDIRYREG